jgi:hypothetical protein
LQAEQRETADSTADNRVARRTNLFLSATVGSDRWPDTTVRVRNVSTTGALIEGTSLPLAGEAVVLKRGEIHVPAMVMWADGIRRGVRFSHPVSTDIWSPSKPATSAGQERVDAIQAAIRSGKVLELAPAPAVTAPASAPASEAGKLEDKLACELKAVQDLLESIGEQLICDMEVVQRHGASLQGIDRAHQVLGHVADVIRSADRARAVDGICMADLRHRLLA